jgi:hypothetical protein
MSTTQSREFPRYLLSIEGQKKFVTMQEAGVLYDSGHLRVECLDLVLGADFSVRGITHEEISEMCRIADAHSASK